MNYRHIFHAGNFSDVFKHTLLIALIHHLQQKDTPFCYIESHAGTGCYDLQSIEAQKSKEFECGIQRIIEEKSPPKVIQDYLDCVKKINPENTLRFYPGSPFFVRQFLRAKDRMILSELHTKDYQTLKQFFRADKQIAVHHQDGYQSLKAFLPPKERRGLVLIDPPYEEKNELIRLPSLLSKIIARWETGIYAIWYPIKSFSERDYFYEELKKNLTLSFLKMELYVYPDDIDNRLNGCGMIIINPPWQFENRANDLLSWLQNKLQRRNN